VALARALSREKPLLILDGDFDHALDALLRDLLATVPHLCSILTTSRTADARAWKADRVGLIEVGRLIAVGTMADLAASLDPDVRGALSWTMACESPRV
jgi:ABC-type thiamine transport system ATPase subunit